MKRLLNILVLFLAVTLTGCHDNDIYNEMPQEIELFTDRYFPDVAVSDFTHSGDTYHLTLRNGPGITFGPAPDYSWIAVNGYGSTLPAVFMFDQLPPELYVYLQENQVTDGVYAVERDTVTYRLTLLDNTITYTIADQHITET